jgi:hypothetical protein
MKSLELTLSVSSCLGCGFCPQEKLAAAYKSDKRKFTMEDFILVLSKLPKDCRVDFSGFAEPFLNPLAPQMICLAKKQGFEVAVYTTLVGLTSAGAGQLPRNLDLVRLHVPDLKGLVIPDDRWIRQHVIFRETHIPYTAMAMGTMSPKVEAYLKEQSVTVDMPTMLSRGGNLWDVKRNTGHIICSMDRWHSNVCLPNLDVVGDCMDYACSVKLGNLGTQSYDDIYAAAEAWKHSFKEESSICSKCEWNAGNAPK